ncbi:MAG TPA: alpha/beta hydrolase-fold protein [Solirubrobacteraceae bacterium]|nr:alpha/beta hydrolase-fold protein [Solirubrobacteraceae bacterium]
MPPALVKLVLGAASALALAAPATTAAEGDAKVLTGSFRSAAVAGPLHYSVYLPAGYDGAARRYPVIYLLHGLPDGGNGWRSGIIRQIGQAAQSAGHPAIVVAPQGARPGDTDPEWHDWGKGRNWESAVVWETVATIDHRYRTIARRADRALIGISAGGYGAMLIGLHHLGRFSVVQAWSGYFHPTNRRGDAPLDVGSDAEDRRASAHTYVRGLRARLKRWPSFLGFYVGASDPFFVSENRAFHAELKRAGVPHRFAVYPGGHTGALWSAHAGDWASDAAERIDNDDGAATR